MFKAIQQKIAASTGTFPGPLLCVWAPENLRSKFERIRQSILGLKSPCSLPVEVPAESVEQFVRSSQTTAFLNQEVKNAIDDVRNSMVQEPGRNYEALLNQLDRYEAELYPTPTLTGEEIEFFKAGVSRGWLFAERELQVQ